MSRFGIGVALVVACGRTASAEPVGPESRERSFFGGDVHIGRSDSAWTQTALMFEAGGRIPGVPSPFGLRPRAFMSIVGRTAQSDLTGDFVRYGAGVEGLVCARFVCGFVDLDVGWEHATLTVGNTVEGDRSGGFVGPRLGVEAGGRVRARLALELFEWKMHHAPSQWQTNAGVTLGVLVRL